MPLPFREADGYGRTMAYARTRTGRLLEPVDLAAHLDKVELYLGQVCRLAGISKMQLDYWTNKAQIPTKGQKQRIYDIDAIETVMLIKQAQGQGPEPRRRDRRRPALPRAAARGSLARRFCSVQLVAEPAASAGTTR